MKIASVGLEFPIPAQVVKVALTSRHTFLDFDVLILDLAGIRSELGGERVDLGWRKTEILQMLRMRRNIFVLMCPFRMSELFHIGNYLVFDEGAGTRVRFNGPDKLRAFWDNMKDFSAYIAKWQSDALGKPFLYVEGLDNAVVGSHFKCDAGNIFFIPAFEFREDCLVADAVRAVQTIVALVESIKPNAKDIQLPKWTLCYGWKHLDRLSTELDACRTELAKLTKLESELAEAHLKEDGLKLLIAGTGDALANQVVEVMRAIGFKAEPGPTGRDDIILQWNGKFAVVEVKGKTKTAAEADAAQVEKWVSTNHADKGTHAKGILIVNAFCEIPLEKRTESPYPHQMLKYSSQREHCLMTTTQLLGILLEIRVHPSRQVELIESIFSTVGVYPHFADFRKFLKAREKGD